MCSACCYQIKEQKVSDIGTNEILTYLRLLKEKQNLIQDRNIIGRGIGKLPVTWLRTHGRSGEEKDERSDERKQEVKDVLRKRGRVYDLGWMRNVRNIDFGKRVDREGFPRATYRKVLGQ